MAKQRFALNIELSQVAPSQSTISNFNSVTRVGDVYLAANDDGIFAINECDDAAGANINGYFELIKTDFGIRNPKHLRSLFAGYECSGTLLLAVTVDDYYTRSFTMPPVMVGQKQHGNIIDLTEDLFGRYFSFKIANTEGFDFSFDLLDVDYIVTNSRPRGVI